MAGAKGAQRPFVIAGDRHGVPFVAGHIAPEARLGKGGSNLYMDFAANLKSRFGWTLV